MWLFCLVSVKKRSLPVNLVNPEGGDPTSGNRRIFGRLELLVS